MYVCGDADIGWGKSPIILRLNSLDKGKKCNCNPILAPVQHAILLSVNREYLLGVLLLLLMMLMLHVIQRVRYLPILPRYIRVRTGVDGEGKVLVLQKDFFLCKVSTV